MGFSPQDTSRTAQYGGVSFKDRKQRKRSGLVVVLYGCRANPLILKGGEGSESLILSLSLLFVSLQLSAFLSHMKI